MDRTHKLKQISNEIAKLEDEKYRVYKEWSDEIKDLFSDNEPKFLKITRDGHDIYLYLKTLNGGVCATPTISGYKKVVTSKFIGTKAISLLKHNETYHLWGSYHLGIDTEFEIITKEEFDKVFADFVKTNLSPTKDNVKWAYTKYDLEWFKEIHPEYFDIDEVNFFIERFNYVDNVMNEDNEDTFDDWL